MQFILYAGFHHEKALFLCKKENSVLSEHACQITMQLSGIIQKLPPPTGDTDNTFVWSLGTVKSAHAPLNCDDGDLLPDTYLHLIKRNKC